MKPIFLYIFQGFLAIEAMADGGVRVGLPRDLAQKLAAQTLMVRRRNNIALVYDVSVLYLHAVCIIQHFLPPLAVKYVP